MEDKSSMDTSHLLTISGIFFVVVMMNKYSPVVAVWLRPVEHKMLILALISVPAGLLIYRSIDAIQRWLQKRRFDLSIIGMDDDSVFCGNTLSGEGVFIKTKQRGMHTQVVGTTNAGKTESVILPWAIQDIQQKRGLILIDGKADRSLLVKIYAYTVKAGRKNDFKLFSLSNINESSQFNPLIGGTTEQIAERVFNAFEFDNPYYRSVQFEIFGQVLRIFDYAKITPTFERLHQAISQPKRMLTMVDDQIPTLQNWLTEFLGLDSQERDKRTSGLTAALSHFAFGETSVLFNTESPTIDLAKALKNNQIIYFQLPVLFAPFLGKASGKLVLQALQSAVADRHKGKKNQKPVKFFSIFLDDFTEYLYPGFVSILNKTRSANIGVVFAHQALGDIKTLGDAIANSILTNSNLKIFMRGSDPESAEYFSRVIGTRETTKFTERTRKSFGSPGFTGDASARAVEEFVVHPNRFKSTLGVGEAVMVIPHEKGSKSVHMKFKMIEDLPALNIRKIAKVRSEALPETESIKIEKEEPCNLTFSSPQS